MGYCEDVCPLCTLNKKSNEERQRITAFCNIHDGCEDNCPCLKCGKPQPDHLCPKELMPPMQPVGFWHKSSEMPPPKDRAILGLFEKTPKVVAWNDEYWAVSEFQGEDSPPDWWAEIELPEGIT